MTWTKLALGTAVLSALTLGTAIYYAPTSRNQVRTEDVIELDEAIAERALALSTSIVTNTLVWSNAVWSVDPVTNRYWVSGSGTNGITTNFVVFSGWERLTNTFISTQQYFRTWVAITSQVGRIREPLHRSYSVNGYQTGSLIISHTYDGVYAFSDYTTNGTGIVEYRWTNGAYVLSVMPQDQQYVWKLQNLVTYRDDLQSGSMAGSFWYYWLTGAKRTVNISPSAEIMDQMTIVSSNRIGTNVVITTNTVPVPPLEYPARSVTNVANAIGIYNSKALVDAIDTSINNLLPSFVDMSQESGGTFDAWFAVHTNATALPALSLVRAFELLGPSCGTNIVEWWGGTNGYWLNYPARGTNAAIYGSNVIVVTKEALIARYKVLNLMSATQRASTWGVGTQLVRSVNETEPIGNYGEPGTTAGGYEDVLSVIQTVTEGPFSALTNAWYLPEETGSSIAGQAPSVSSSAVLSFSGHLWSFLRKDYSSGLDITDLWRVLGININTGIGVELMEEAPRVWTWYRSASGDAIREFHETVRKASLRVTLSPAYRAPTSVEYYCRLASTNGYVYQTTANTITATNALSPLLSAGSPQRWDGLRLLAPVTTNWVSTNDAPYTYGWIHQDGDEIDPSWWIVSGGNSLRPKGIWDAGSDYYGIGYTWQRRASAGVQWAESSTNLTGVTRTLQSGPALIRWSFNHCTNSIP